jgi:hypothetical protein
MQNLRFLIVLGLAFALQPQRTARHTVVGIEGREFVVNGRPTYAGRSYDGARVQGLLFNSRMVQGIFDDRNPETRGRWNYPDGPWDPERNTREFIAAMPLWKAKGLLAFTINLQGGSPEGYSRSQPWMSSAFETDGRLRPDFMSRLQRILDRADELGMVAIVGFFYQGQERRMDDEPSVIRAAEAATDWLLDKGYTNVLVEVANEADNAGFKHDVIKPSGGALQLIERLKERSKNRVASPAGRLLVSTSLNGGKVPADSLAGAVDFVLLHGNGVRDPARITQMVDETRKLSRYRGQPIVFNEDDHFDFNRPQNNMLVALRAYASWGYFDYRLAGERFDDGYQSVPVNWTISSQRKREFFELLATVTGVPK